MEPNAVTNFDDFDGPNEFAFLSNFYKGEPLKVFNRTWATGEHAFAGMKTIDKEQRRRIQKAKSPGTAKALGRRVILRPDWEEIKYDVMMTILRRKFTLEREEGQRLLVTGNALLVEGTKWNDRVWGVNGHTATAVGRNWLGTMLMARRAELLALACGSPDFCTADHAENWIMGKDRK